MKLRKLILSGFKSFADRTEFEFDDGVSGIVGPNGCGKSNIVDAFKWVLGSQSAKSLRGSEMMDVIFNGCSTRRPAGCAEVTMVFESADGTLQLPEGLEAEDAAHIAVTRRLYRSGQSEYLVNKVPVRLRDIREMFMDTGVGVDAYSLIEQGRVEVFLQASQDDRRAIFDEAAGISKYKARKKEALRKLERVEQNLLRLSDILAEVEKRLRSIKVQAGKARNYQAYAERLKELRSLHFLAQYHTRRQSRHQLAERLEAANDELSGESARIHRLEAAQSAAEVELVEQERAASQLQSRTAELGGQITTREERVEMLTSRIAELAEQVVAASARCEQLEAKIEASQVDLGGLNNQLGQLAADREGLAKEFDAQREKHLAGQAEIDRIAGEIEDEKAGTIDLLRRTAQLHNEIHGHQVRRENLTGQHEKLTGRAAEIAGELEELFGNREEVQSRLDETRSVLEEARGRLDETRSRQQQLGDDAGRIQEELAEAREQRSALLSRRQTLQEMQSRREGVAEGVRRLLEARQQGTLECVAGLLGEFVRTDTAHAALVEAALGSADQLVLVNRFEDLRDPALIEALGPDGTVEGMPLDRPAPMREDFDASACPPIRSRLIEHVRCEPLAAPILWRMLGRTFLVDDLPAAAEAARLAPAGSRFVTAAGEVLEADGRVRLGSASRGSGLIARTSELQELLGQLAELEQSIEALQDRQKQVQTRRDHLDEVLQKLRTAIYEANTERVEAESRLARLADRIESLQREQPVVGEDLQRIAEQIEHSQRSEREGREKVAELEDSNRRRQEHIDELSGQLAQRRTDHQGLAERMTELKVALAENDQKQNSVRQAASALQRQREQLEGDLESARSEISLARQRRTDAETAIAEARAEIERFYADQQKLQEELEEAEQSRRSLQQRLEEIRTELAQRRKAHDAASAAVNARRVELNEADVRLENLLSRAADEMNMDLRALYADYQHDEQRDWQAVESEIAELRGKIERLGNVNLDAIAEQEELQQRQAFLTEQLQDVQDSQKQLTELIRRINTESRQKFLESFEKVRENFQELFRKLFGGGKADVYLLDPEDVLESGIEVVARPPGKELRSISLLSGGEKTMTALALLFSIFKSRPSPVCLLDEVDAALDEANTERFNRLVGEFIGTSQFLIITHAKRTMSMANVLYGVTMQEAGVSRRISVRFEQADDVLEDRLQPA